LALCLGGDRFDRPHAKEFGWRDFWGLTQFKVSLNLEFRVMIGLPLDVRSVSMTRKIHDTFAKEWIRELLADFGEVEVEKQVGGEVRTIDLLFHPHPEALPNLQALGLLGRMVSSPALLEPFRNAVPEWEVRNCREKLFQLEAALRRQAKQRQGRLSQVDRPFVWVLSPTLSRQQQSSFRVLEKAAWGEGIYFLADSDRTAVVAIHQLPKTLDTLWLRLLGRGQVQGAAVAELLALPIDHPYRQETLRHIAVLQINLQVQQNKTRDLREVMMNLAPAYEKWLQETLEKGRQETQMTIALRLLQKDMPLDEISECTGLSIEALQALRFSRGEASPTLGSTR
jgi:hypothetical protein